MLFIAFQKVDGRGKGGVASPLASFSLPLPIASPSPLRSRCIYSQFVLAGGCKIQAFKLPVFGLLAGVQWACFRPDLATS